MDPTKESLPLTGSENLSASNGAPAEESSAQQVDQESETAQNTPGQLVATPAQALETHEASEAAVQSASSVNASFSPKPAYPSNSTFAPHPAYSTSPAHYNSKRPSNPQLPVNPELSVHSVHFANVTRNNHKPNQAGKASKDLSATSKGIAIESTDPAKDTATDEEQAAVARKTEPDKKAERTMRRRPGKGGSEPLARCKKNRRSVGEAYELGRQRSIVISNQYFGWIGKITEKFQEPKVRRIIRYIKITYLMCLWIFSMIVYAIFDDTRVVAFTSIGKDEVASIPVLDVTPDLHLMLDVQGPFVEEYERRKARKSPYGFCIAWLERHYIKSDPNVPELTERGKIGAAAYLTEKHDITASMMRHKMYLTVPIGPDDPRKKGTMIFYSLQFATAGKIPANYTMFRSRRQTPGDDDDDEDDDETTTDQGAVSESYSILDDVIDDARRGDRSSNILRQIQTSQIPLGFSLSKNPPCPTRLAGLAFLLLVLLVLSDVLHVNRALSTSLVASAAVGVLSIVDVRPSIYDMSSWLSLDTLMLITSMLMIVAIAAETGVIDVAAVKVYKLSGGKMWNIVHIMCGFGLLMTYFFNNLFTSMLLTPVTIRVCEFMAIDPVPMLMTTITFMNLGGLMTPVAALSNIEIWSNEAVASMVDFWMTSLYMVTLVGVLCVQTYVTLRLIYRFTKRLEWLPPDPDVNHELKLWRRLAECIPALCHHWEWIRADVAVRGGEGYLPKNERYYEYAIDTEEYYIETLETLEANYKLRNQMLLLKVIAVVSCLLATTMFLPLLPSLQVGLITYMAALMMLSLLGKEFLEPVYLRVDWTTVIFFAALYVLGQAIKILVDLNEEDFITIMYHNIKDTKCHALIYTIWVSGICSALFNNTLIVFLMGEGIISTGYDSRSTVGLVQLIWAFSVGTGLGGNFTTISSAVNVLCVGTAEQQGYRVRRNRFIAFSFPILLGNLIVATIFTVLFNCVVDWS